MGAVRRMHARLSESVGDADAAVVVVAVVAVVFAAVDVVVAEDACAQCRD